jgi:hypothetical protein
LRGLGAGRRLTSGPSSTHSTVFYLFNFFQTDLSLNQSKDGLPMLNFFEIKYGIVSN